MNGFGENSRYLLRKRSVLGSCFAAKRFFEVVGYVSSDKNAFAICHLSASLIPSGIFTLQIRNRSVSRILYFDSIEVAIIHLVQPLPAGSSDLPGGRSEPKFASGGQPF